MPLVKNKIRQLHAVCTKIGDGVYKQADQKCFHVIHYTFVTVGDPLYQHYTLH